MDINLEYYKVFYYAAKTGNLSDAAKELFVSQPAVSQSIRQLEEMLGCVLFTRTSKGVRLTAEGELLYSYIEKGYGFIKLAENKLREMTGLESGEVRIGASDMTLRYYLLPYLEQFHKLHPKVKVHVTNAPTPDTIELLKTGRIDFGIVSTPFSQTGLSGTPVCRIQDIFIASKLFERFKGEKIDIAALAELPLICLEKGTSTRSYIESIFKTEGAELKPEFELATSDLIVEFTKRNLGIGCVVKNFALQGLEDGTLFEIKLKNPIPSREICVITSDKLPISPAGKALLKLLI